MDKGEDCKDPILRAKLKTLVNKMFVEENVSAKFDREIIEVLARSIQTNFVIYEAEEAETTGKPTYSTSLASERKINLCIPKNGKEIYILYTREEYSIIYPKLLTPIKSSIQPEKKLDYSPLFDKMTPLGNSVDAIQLMHAKKLIVLLYLTMQDKYELNEFIIDYPGSRSIAIEKEKSSLILIFAYAILESLLYQKTSSLLFDYFLESLREGESNSRNPFVKYGGISKEYVADMTVLIEKIKKIRETPGRTKDSMYEFVKGKKSMINVIMNWLISRG